MYAQKRQPDLSDMLVLNGTVTLCGSFVGWIITWNMETYVQALFSLVAWRHAGGHTSSFAAVWTNHVCHGTLALCNWLLVSDRAVFSAVLWFRWLWYSLVADLYARVMQDLMLHCDRCRKKGGAYGKNGLCNALERIIALKRWYKGKQTWTFTSAVFLYFLFCCAIFF